MNDKNKEDYINMKKQEYIYRCMQKYVKRAAAVFVIGCMVTGLATGCSTNGKSKGSQASLLKEQTREVFAMDTYMTLKAYGKNAGKALDASVKEIERIENLVSTGKKTSEIARINQNGSGKVSEDTMKLILRSRELYEDTDGAFDITVYPVMEAWGFTTEKYRIPGKTELQKLLANMDADKIICDEKKGTVKLDQKGMKIDLGGIAKGYTSGRVMEIMKKYGVKNAVISLGGNVQTLNSKPDGSAWQIAVEDPQDKSSYIGVLSLRNQAAITSGGYERYFEKNGKKYHHIIDPKTGYPSENGLSSVTIVSKDGTLADGLSTSLFIMGRKKATTYWKKHTQAFDTVMDTDRMQKQIPMEEVGCIRFWQQECKRQSPRQ